MAEWLPYLAGLSIALAAGALGPFVVWRRMAYFGDSLAHSSLLGIALGVSFHLSTTPIVVVTSLAFAMLLVWLQSRHYFTTDTLLGVMSHAALSIGMVAASLLSHIHDHKHDLAHDSHDGQAGHLDIHQYFFGDLSGIDYTSILWIGIISLVICVIVARLWQPLVLMTLHTEMAKAEGIPTMRLQLLFMAMMALFVAVSIQLVGVLLITAMLIIPAAAARPWVSTPAHMATVSCSIAFVSIVTGLRLYETLAAPSGPTIVTIATLIFCLSLLLRSGKSWQR